ncbi:serine hydrolase [Xanthobacter sp. ZOL 2024]
MFMRTASASLSLLTKTVAMAVLAGFVFSATTADAKPRKRAQIERSKERGKSKPRKVVSRSAPSSAETSRWHYGSAAIVVDANTGRVLYEQDADALRHPASVTKVMTLYMLFEQLENGRLKLTSQLPVSSKAAAQSPSKLGLRPGSSIEVEDAIKAVVTRSANDVAVVIAEAIGGTESNFAEMMTAKARALGMERTTYRNASGLPNPNQLTTARDLSILGRAIQDRFPKQYRYFATRTFYYRGEAIGNHNRLLGRMEGVDGIKTGYTNASGFNLLTSLKDDNRYLIGVVLGGRTASSRDARMRDILNDNLPRAYAGGRTVPKITENGNRLAFNAPLPQPVEREAIPAHEVAPLPKPALAVFSDDPEITASLAARAKSGSVEPIKPVAVKTVSIQRQVAVAAPPPQAAAASANAAGRGFAMPAGVLGYLGPSDAGASPATQAATQAAQGRARGRAPAPTPAPARMEVAMLDEADGGKDDSRFIPQQRPADLATRAAQVASQEPARSQPRTITERPVQVASIAPVSLPAPRPQPTAVRSGWKIQIGAFDAESQARARLDLAQNKAKSLLGNADPYTEKVTKGNSALYRARFAGLDKKSAEAACRLLQRNAFACMTIRN